MERLFWIDYFYFRFSILHSIDILNGNGNYLIPFDPTTIKCLIIASFEVTIAEFLFDRPTLCREETVLCAVNQEMAEQQPLGGDFIDCRLWIIGCSRKLSVDA